MRVAERVGTRAAVAVGFVFVWGEGCLGRVLAGGRARVRVWVLGRGGGGDG